MYTQLCKPIASNVTKEEGRLTIVKGIKEKIVLMSKHHVLFLKKETYRIHSDVSNRYK